MADEPDEDDPDQAAIAELPALEEDGHAPSSQLPAVLHEYQLMHVAGRGGMGEVWQARHLFTRKPYAIKVLRPELVGDEIARARFIQEARVMEALVHPNILRVFHVGEQEGHLYFVMEWVEGGTVADLLSERGTFTLFQARDVLWQMIDGLSHAYDRGLVHRDVKPGNVMMKRGRDAKITDFGIAKFLGADEHHTGSGVRLGSPWYMSPEQIRGGDVDHRTDIYSLGITLYQLLTGDVPFDGELISVLYRHVHDPVPITFELEHLGNGAVLPIIRKMTAKDPDDRYQSYDDLQFAVTRLGDVVEGTGRLTPPAGLRIFSTSTNAARPNTPLAERLDTFHELGTVPIDEKGGLSLSGLSTIKLGRNASTMDVAALDPIHPSAKSQQIPFMGTLGRVKEEAVDTVAEVVSGGKSSLAIALILVFIVALLAGGAALLQMFLPGLGKRARTSQATAGETQSAGPTKPSPVAQVSAATPQAPMQPLSASTDPVTLQSQAQRGYVSIQELGSRLIGQEPVEILRVLGTPEFTDETKLGGGLYYSASQWGTLIYDASTSRTIGRVKVLFFNGRCKEVHGS
ncbi:MAG: serine/threonine-protein kinase [Candidatus Sumerlaeaceae bacterium]